MNENSLLIPFISGIKADTPLETISGMLDQQQKQAIAISPWPQFDSSPKVQFAIAHADFAILLKYYVEEAETLVRYTQPNEPVYRDSAVEFFIAFDDEAYYNFEFNSLGTCLGGYGHGRPPRSSQPAALLKTIRSLPEKITTDSPLSKWTLTLVIPVGLFSFHPVTSLHGKKCRVNFYKCGDDLKKPQYLVWHKVEWPEPNFHLPQFFGDAEFL